MWSQSRIDCLLRRPTLFRVIEDGKKCLVTRHQQVARQVVPLSSNDSIRIERGLFARITAIGVQLPVGQGACIIGTRCHPQAHLNSGARFQLDETNQLSRCFQRSEIVKARVRLPRDHKEIRQFDRAVFSDEARFEDRAIVPILALCPRAFDRVKLEAAALRLIEQRAAKRARIKRRKAEPVDPAVRVDQRRGLAVPDEGVIPNRGHRIQPPTAWIGSSWPASVIQAAIASRVPDVGGAELDGKRTSFVSPLIGSFVSERTTKSWSSFRPLFSPAFTLMRNSKPSLTRYRSNCRVAGVAGEKFAVTLSPSPRAIFSTPGFSTDAGGTPLFLHSRPLRTKPGVYTLLLFHRAEYSYCRAVHCFEANGSRQPRRSQ